MPLFHNTTKFVSRAVPVLAGLLAAANAHAQRNWTGNGLTQSWDEAANWSSSTIPVGVQATINTGTTESTPAVITNGVAATPGSLYLGADGNTSGYLLVEGGSLTLTGDTYLGRSHLGSLEHGFGSLVNRGGSVALRDVRAGGDRGSPNTPYGHGRLIHESGTLDITGVFYFGIGGNVYMEADADFTVLGGNTHFGYRGNTNGWATQTMDLGAITASFLNINFCYNSGDNLESTIIMRGTTLESTAIAMKSAANHKSVISGWGILRGGTLMPRGKIIANGGGAARDLDVRHYYTTTTMSDVGAAMIENVGWYAVDKGRMVFKDFTRTVAGNFEFCLGDRETNWRLVLANTARVTLTSCQPGDIKPFLLAPDYPGVPDTGYPLSAVKSVWKFETPSFNNATIVFRYDETSVRGYNETFVNDPLFVKDLRMLRYNPANMAWERVATTYNAATRRFTASNLQPLGADNLGFFALVELPPPTLFILK